VSWRNAWTSGKQSKKGFEKGKVTVRKKIKGPRRGRTHGIHLAKEDHCSQLPIVGGDWQQIPDIS
jgi:hypothetical protein